MPSRWRDVCFLSDQFCQAVECRYFGAGQDVCSCRCGGDSGAEIQAGDEIADVRQVIKNLAIPENDESSACDAPKQFQQTAIARTIDSRRSRNYDLDAAVPRSVAGNRLPFELRFLVNVTRPKWRIFICRRTFDITVNADGAAVDDAFRTTGFRSLDDGANRRCVHRPVLLFAKASLSIDRSNVVDDLDAVGRSFDCLRVCQISMDHVNLGVRSRSDPDLTPA